MRFWPAGSLEGDQRPHTVTYCDDATLGIELPLHRPELRRREFPTIEQRLVRDRHLDPANQRFTSAARLSPADRRR